MHMLDNGRKFGFSEFLLSLLHAVAEGVACGGVAQLCGVYLVPQDVAVGIQIEGAEGAVEARIEGRRACSRRRWVAAWCRHRSDAGKLGVSVQLSFNDTLDSEEHCTMSKVLIPLLSGDFCLLMNYVLK